MPSDTPETKAEILAKLEREVHEPQRFLSLDATRFNPEAGDLSPEDLELLELDRQGWSVGVEREHRLEIQMGVRVLVEPGLGLDQVLERLDRIRAELVAKPELLSKDWSKPLPSARPRLRLVEKD